MIRNIPISCGRLRLITASTSASIGVPSRFTSQRQKLDTVDCRTRIVVSAR
jgi:hypothetical protein